jgi:hypothetical protein
MVTVIVAGDRHGDHDDRGMIVMMVVMVVMVVTGDRHGDRGRWNAARAGITGRCWRS